MTVLRRGLDLKLPEPAEITKQSLYFFKKGSLSQSIGDIDYYGTNNI